MNTTVFSEDDFEEILNKRYSFMFKGEYLLDFSYIADKHHIDIEQYFDDCKVGTLIKNYDRELFTKLYEAEKERKERKERLDS